MILTISDVHCQYQIINSQVSFAEEKFQKKVSRVLVLGDFGLFDSNLHQFFIVQRQNFIRPVYFIEGNHEDFNHFELLVEKYKTFFTYLPRCSIQDFEGCRILCLGGAKYMDALNTPWSSEIRPADIEKCLSYPKDSVEIIISHDCPSGIGVPNTPGLEHYGPPGFEGGMELEKHFQPKIWVFGHHHKWFNRSFRNTKFFGLPESWKGFGILEGKDTFSITDHSIERDEVFWKKWIKKLF